MFGATAREQPDLDLYGVLGVEPGASSAQIGRAYRRLARRYHPDVNTTPGVAERFAKVTHAYRVLSDPGARTRYDATRAVPRGVKPAHRATAAQDVFWVGSYPSSHAFHLGTDIPFSPAAAEEAEVQMSVEEAYHGTSRAVTVTSHDRSETVEVVIPRGVITGERIAVPMMHLPGGPNARAVILRVRIVPRDRYRVEGRDLHVRLPLSPWEAALGAIVPVDSPAGPATIEVPIGTSSGLVLTLPGQGIPNPAGAAGSIYAHVTIVLPAQLTRAEAALFEQLAATSTFDPRRPTTEAQP